MHNQSAEYMPVISYVVPELEKREAPVHQLLWKLVLYFSTF